MTWDRSTKPEASGTKPPSLFADFYFLVGPWLGTAAKEIHRTVAILAGYSLKSSFMRLIWERLTGIWVCFLSSIFSMKVALNQGRTSLMW
jgi:hypothetical protein